MKKLKAITPDTIARAKRARSARKFAGLTMEQLNIQHNIPPSTLQGWENTGCSSLKNRSLTLRGAQRLVEALEKEGVACSIEWLMEGTGLGPSFASMKQNQKANAWAQTLSLQNEIQAFENNNPNSIVVILPDDTLEPFYNKGDIVGGIKHYLNDIAQFIEHCCIIETKNKDIFVRKLQASKSAHHYSLININAKTTSSEATIKNVAVNWVAPILWHRKHLQRKG